MSGSIINLSHKPYWSILYSNLNKLAYVLNRDVERLESPEALSIEHQAYPDLSGRLIQPVTAPSSLEESPRQREKPVETSPRPKGRVLD
ncbi:hypothetical protein [Desulfobotulus mexicanus]|uniref:Uncharacterized protein n=1 Tax=Desulfobotulus mexicanus TaxID=2586642 RepID=A0A5S5MDT4_9BACT|nr:hypothetical protein [Desulfobotulus mexicanus]TYT73785.1 hypothetical protein FIM25_13135 [Desulfobotulus mexicanus]